MKIEEILLKFCDRNEIAYDPAAAGGAVAFQVGDGTVIVQPDFGRDALNVLTSIGVPPAEGAESFELQMLQENLVRAESDDAYLSFDSESGLYVAAETVMADGLDADALQEIVTALAGLRDDWRARLADFSSGGQRSGRPSEATDDEGVIWA